MNRPSHRAGPLVWPAILLALCASTGVTGTPADSTAQTPPGLLDYSEPKLLTGTVYEKGSALKKILFTFRRTTTQSNATVRALMEFRSPSGALAARGRVLYAANKLVSCELEELQTGAHGIAWVSSHAEKAKMLFEYTPGKGSRTKTGNESLQQDTLVNDMMAPFIRAHWDGLSQGSAVKFRYAALERAETVGFKLVKDAETIWREIPAIRLKMEPTSRIIAALVDPLYFTVEKDGRHRLLEYVGRTTPKILKGGKWKDLDALTVYDWQ
jgi:hypothetical protein